MKLGERPTTVEVAGFGEFGGLHCETASLAKLLRWHGLHYSESMLFGLGGGIGFLYWKTKGMAAPFVGGRNGPFPRFIQRIGERTGHRVRVVTTRSPRRAEEDLREAVARGRPVVCYGDLHFLPYFAVGRHFGGHAFLVYGVDGPHDRAWISDRCSTPRWVSLTELANARASSHRPFPPRHAVLEVEPGSDDRVCPGSVRAAIAGCRTAMVEPPISNLGLAGLRKFAAELGRALAHAAPQELAGLLASAYVDLELAGTGGCAFRRMYRGFLAEAQDVLGADLSVPLAHLDASIARWSEFLAALLPDASPASRRVREALHEKDALFLHGSMDDLPRLSAAAGRVAELTADAASELRVSRAPFDGLAARLLRVAEAEAELFASLGRVVS
jgi:hypothetical protein